MARAAPRVAVAPSAGADRRVGGGRHDGASVAGACQQPARDAAGLSRKAYPPHQPRPVQQPGPFLPAAPAPRSARHTRLTCREGTGAQILSLPPEARNLTALVRLDMEFKALTDLQPLSAVWPAWGKPPPDIIAQASLRFHASRALPGACSA